MSARAAGGWLLADYTGPEMTTIELGVGKSKPDTWLPAFLDWHDGKRVAKIRPPAVGTVTVWLRVAGTVTRVGKVAL